MMNEQTIPAAGIASTTPVAPVRYKRPAAPPTRNLECPRGGWSLLTTRAGQLITVPTVCQTWSCPRCGEKRRRYAAMRAEHGCRSLEWPGPLRLITLTYGFWGADSIQNAPSALADFRRFAQRVRRLNGHQTFRWFRVAEATKRGQVHWHLISGDLAGTKLELERALRNEWALASRRRGVIQNYVVEVTETQAEAASSYVAKYLLKSALGATWLQQRGFKRRWTCSRDWSKPQQTRLVGTLEGLWQRMEWISPFDGRLEVAIGRRVALVSRLAHHVGDQLVDKMANREKERAIARKLGGFLASLSEPDIRTRDSSR